MTPLRGRVPQLWRTVRPLRGEQLWGRLLHEGRQAVFRGLPILLQWRLQRPDAPPAVAFTRPLPPRSPELTALAREGHGTGKLRLAGHEVVPTDWSRPELPKLVRYHLHYLDAARTWMELGEKDDALLLVLRWNDENPPGAGEGWEPYPVSSRLINLAALAAALGPAAPAWLRALIALHARYVQAFPERHLQANHLLKNWTALALAGLLLEGPEAQVWAAVGLREVERELGHQILPDGGHYERSPMYHLLVLWDLLELRDFARARRVALEWLPPLLDAMAQWSASLLHPDGDVPLFNDTVLGQAPFPAELFARLGQVPASALRIFDAKDSGLIALRPGREEALLFDAGPLGPAHQPGHAHSDTLSFELSLDGERRVVNAGMDGYQSEHRAFFRSAVAHNTVTVDGEGPDELWSAFRVGGRSRVLSRRYFDRIDHLGIQASLEAFQGWRQERLLLFFPRRALVVLDRVRSPAAATVVSRLRLVPGKTPLRFVPLQGRAEQRTTAYAPELGRVFEAIEHSVQAEGTDVQLGYALLWGAKDVALEGDALTLDGQRYRVLEAE